MNIRQELWCLFTLVLEIHFYGINTIYKSNEIINLFCYDIKEICTIVVQNNIANITKEWTVSQAFLLTSQGLAEMNL
jgi:hypothetical protein